MHMHYADSYILPHIILQLHTHPKIIIQSLDKGESRKKKCAAQFKDPGDLKKTKGGQMNNDKEEFVVGRGGEVHRLNQIYRHNRGKR